MTGTDWSLSASRRVRALRPLLFVGTAAVATMVVGCGPIGATFNGPIVSNTIVTRQVPGSVEISLEGLTDVHYCSESESLREFCFENAETAFRDGLETMLGSFGLAQGAGGYRAVLRVTDINHWIVNEMAAQMSLVWQFVLFDPAGTPVIQLSETTASPQPLNGTGDLEPSGRAMFAAVLDRIAAELNRLPASAPPTGEVVQTSSN